MSEEGRKGRKGRKLTSGWYSQSEKLGVVGWLKVCKKIR